MITLPINRKRFTNYVKVLDLAHTIQAGKNSYVSKLLRRFSESLEVFVSSQTSFGISPLVSLRLCSNLKVLDLHLVSETVNLKELFKAIEHCQHLEQLSFPRSSITCEDFNIKWPENLWFLKIQGGITDEFLFGSWFPETITNLEFSHCPHITGDSVNDLLMRIGMNLTHLSIYYPMPNMKPNSMDTVFLYCPNLIFLYINIEYISRDAFDENLLPLLEGDYDRPLRTLVIDASGLLGEGAKLHPDDLTIAVCEERLPELVSLKLSRLLGWDFQGDDVSDLVNELEIRDGSLYTI
ncbi:unnamed protein product [Ambrosiozyma monospora]|uniref:Unnamed protein product n=1 Tax=Ambrosiozyma monospora TaxID=43982 RepID=A0ACB5T549_AMBMO|nr:unnamed protein product [Ambrosiozyma monospora]